jgi:hypothetical protein
MDEEIEKKGEVLPAQGQTIRLLGFEVKRGNVAVIAKGGIAILLLGTAEWLFQNFLQLRGIVNLLASRIDLALFGLTLMAILWVLTVGIARKAPLRLIGALVVTGGCTWLDWSAPRLPNPNESAAQQPSITKDNVRQVLISWLANYPAIVSDPHDMRQGYVHLMALTLNGRKIEVMYGLSMPDRIMVGFTFDIPFPVQRRLETMSEEDQNRFGREFSLELTRGGAHCYSESPRLYGKVMTCTDDFLLSEASKAKLFQLMSGVEMAHNLCILTMGHLLDLDLHTFV